MWKSTVALKLETSQGLAAPEPTDCIIEPPPIHPPAKVRTQQAPDRPSSIFSRPYLGLQGPIAHSFVLSFRDPKWGLQQRAL